MPVPGGDFEAEMRELRANTLAMGARCERSLRLALSAFWEASEEQAAEVKELVPFINEAIILGGFYTPGVGVVDSLRAGTIMRERAQAMGALQVDAKTEVTGLELIGLPAAW